jgi:hypothetical protein
MNYNILNNKEKESKENKIDKEERCFKCDNSFLINFVSKSNDFSKKNNWGY